MMPLIEIVTHVFCPPGLDQYAQQLRVQAASLIYWPPTHCRVHLTACYFEEDKATTDVIQELLLWKRPAFVTFAAAIDIAVTQAYNANFWMFFCKLRRKFLLHDL